MNRSLRARLLAGSLLWIFAALSVTGFLLAELFGRHVEARFESELRIHLEQLAAGVDLVAGDVPRLRADLSDPRFRQPYSGLYWQVDRVAPAPAPALLRSRSLWDAALQVPADPLADGAEHRHAITGPRGEALIMLERVLRLAEGAGSGLRLIIAADARGIQDPVQEFVGQLVLALGVLAAGLMLAVVLQVVVGLAPLRRLRAGLAEVRAGRTRSLAGQFPREIQPLVDELNAVLLHDAEVVARARTHAGNLAHALNTPLAVLANAAAREEGAFAALVGEQVSVARRHVDHHLSRARAAAAVQVPGMSTPLEPVVEGLLRVMRRVHAERALAIGVAPLPAGLAFRGEEQDLQEMLGNVIDNACKWARSRVDVEAVREGGALVVVIDDDGPGLAVAEREAVFARGRRLDEAMPGSGLGLGISRDLAQAYGGEITLGESPAGGLRVALRLPAVAG